MPLPAPATLADVLADGLFVSAAQDLAFAQALGPVSSAEYNFAADRDGAGAPLPDVPVQLRIDAQTGVHDLEGTRLAVLRDGQWTWATSMTAGLTVPELSGTQPYSPKLLAAARTVVGGSPVLNAEQDDALAAVAVAFRGNGVPLSEAIAAGLAQSTPATDERRALGAYAQATGQQIPAPRFDGTRLTGWGSSLTHADVRADAHYLAAEHQFFVDARFPHAQVTPRLLEGRATVSAGGHAFEAVAPVLATITDDTWTWAWADEELAPPARRAAANVRRFGADHGIADFLRPHLPAARAFALGLAQAAMPILQLWTLVPVALSPTTTGLFLLDAPQLRLPDATVATHSAILAVPLPDGLDAVRAQAAYRAARG